MPCFQFSKLLEIPHIKTSILTLAPMIFLLVGLESIMDVKFSCPCRNDRNKVISIFIFVVPALVVFGIMYLVLRPCKYESSSRTCQGPDSRGTFQGQDKRKTFQVVLVCFIPCLVWISICFIDGDYLACGLTDWNGHYACDKELHPICLNWCKPTKLSPGKNETECYDKTLEFIFISKTTGYVLAIVFSVAAIIFLCFYDKSKTSAGPTDQEQQGQGNEVQPEQHTENIPMSNIENATENASLLNAPATPP